MERSEVPDRGQENAAEWAEILYKRQIRISVGAPLVHFTLPRRSQSSPSVNVPGTSSSVLTACQAPEPS